MESEKDSRLWIVKPRDLAHSRNIKVSNQFFEIESFIQANELFDSKQIDYIIQEYIREPLLFENKKF